MSATKITLARQMLDDIQEKMEHARKEWDTFHTFGRQFPPTMEEKMEDRYQAGACTYMENLYRVWNSRVQDEEQAMNHKTKLEDVLDQLDDIVDAWDRFKSNIGPTDYDSGRNLGVHSCADEIADLAYEIRTFLEMNSDD